VSKERLEAKVLENLQSVVALRGLISAVRGPWYPTLGLLLATTAAGLAGYDWLVTMLLLTGVLTASKTSVFALALTDDALYVFRFRFWRKIERSQVLPLSPLPVELDRLSLTLEGTRYWIAPRYLGGASQFGDYLATAAPAA